MSPSPAWLLPGDPSPGPARVVCSCPFAFSGTGRGSVCVCDFPRHLHSVLDSTKKQTLNFGILSLSSHYPMYERRMHSSYTRIFGMSERRIVLIIILIDCQLLCLWKLVLFLGDLELLILARRATSLTRYSSNLWLPHITSFCSHFPHRVGNHQILSLFRQVSELMFVVFCVWISGKLLCLFLF